MKIAMRFSMAALLLSTTVALTQPATQSAAQSAAQSAKQNSAGEAPAKKGLRAKSKAEFDTYQAAAAQTDPVKLEAAATDFAQRYPASELRPFLFQRAMGLYEQANDPGKTLEMARAVLKYDPANPVALLTAAQILADGANDNDLDRDARLAEAGADAQGALQHADEIAQPSSLSANEYAETMAQLRGAAHEVMGTVAYKKRDYGNAIKEYDAATAEEKEHAGPVVWLRLAVAHDKGGDYDLGLADAEKAIAGSEPGSQVRDLAEKERARIWTRKTVKPAQKQLGDSQAPDSGEETHKF